LSDSFNLYLRTAFGSERGLIDYVQVDASCCIVFSSVPEFLDEINRDVVYIHEFENACNRRETRENSLS
jgi:hypothetical protein